MKKELVTIKQAQELAKLGFKEDVSDYAWLHGNNTYYSSKAVGDWNSVGFLSIPKVDHAIDWLRRKFNVIIYQIEPFVDPTSVDNSIIYCEFVKFCNKQMGWNGRERVGQTKWSRNIYAVKRQAITIAIKYIKRRLEAKNRHKARIVKMLKEAKK